MGDRAVTVLYALTLAVGAALLFSVQPMAARMALPVLGGTPAVWNTCMVFFQGILLAGYAVAHLGVGRLGGRAQAGFYLLLIAAGSGVLPVAVAASATSTPEQPALWLLGRLGAELALPGLALAAASPLLQRWFADAGAGRQPYFLYSASNVGSLGALLAYPLLIEPRLDLAVQAEAWTVGYGIWGGLVLACAFLRIRTVGGPNAPTENGVESPLAVPATGHEATWRCRPFEWLGLAAVPTSLLLGCTLFLTTDVASVPLLWVVPLALYLLSFIVAFARLGAPLVRAANRILPFLAAALLFVILARATQPVALLVPLHLGFLFVAGLVCHGRLYASRPAVGDLTAFYLAVAAGGAVGGWFNAFMAPLLFRSVAEYPLAIALACAALPARWRRSARVLPGVPSRSSAVARDLGWAVGTAVALAVLGLVTPWFTEGSTRIRDAVVFGLPAVLAAAALDRPLRLAMTLGLTFAAGLWIQGIWTRTQLVERGFFGVTRVTQDAEGRFRQLVHGNTIHGRQALDPSDRREPLAYYHRLGPLGSVFDAFRQLPGPRTVGVIGLGIGSTAAYALPDEKWTFFEIDPVVCRVAQDTNWFTFLAESNAAELRVVQGDARLRLEAEPDGTLDLLVLDAFSSDAIPVHLLTREAMALYFRKLATRGWLAIHISNRYLALEPVVARLAQDAGLLCRSRDDTVENDIPGKEPSHWLLVARADADLGSIAAFSFWFPAETSGHAVPWTDRRAGVIEAFEWR